jgi:putative transport protein
MLNFESFVTSPFVLLFLAVVLGLLFGKIKIGKFKFGLSGALFSGIALGWAVIVYARSILNSRATDKLAQQLVTNGPMPSDLSNLFLILFIAAVGLLAGKEIKGVFKKYGVKLILIGLIITSTGVGLTYVFMKSNRNFNAHQVAGIYPGALTSSPGLAASLDAAKEHGNKIAATYGSMSIEDKKNVLAMIDKSGKLTPENTKQLTDAQKAAVVKETQADVSSGFTAAFPFGVISIILSVVLIPKIFRIDVEKEKEAFKESMKSFSGKAEGEAAIDSEKVKKGPVKEVGFDLVGFALVCFVGYFLGAITIPLGAIGKFDLGTPGGVLMSALIFSNIGKLGIINFRMDDKILGVIRQFGLVCFLAVTGLSYGYDVINIFGGAGVWLAMMGLVVVLASILMGFVVGRYVFKLNWVILAGAICGGMTSTPGLGAAVDAIGSDDAATGYGATYPFALLCKVLFITILYKLFLM